MNAAPSSIRTRAAILVDRFGHPLFLAAAWLLWSYLGQSDEATLITLVSALAVVTLLESWIPAIPEWRIGGWARLSLIGVYVFGLLISGVLIAAYEAVLVPALAGLRESLGSAIWPSGLPVLVQALMLYFASDFIYYWIHRAIHASPLLWRATGHGFHHGFKNLQAINAGANHPFELFFVVLPLVLLAAVFGAPVEAVSGAGVLLLVNTTLAHANLSMHTPFFSDLFTSSRQHRGHHSAVFEQSNTNYACNAIAWDRLFGTYSADKVTQTGIGPTQPGLWRMYLLPFVEPADADTVLARTRKDD